MTTITYIASPTGAKLHASNKVVRGFLGPVGNGKSVTCLNELHRLAVTQEPNCDGIRKTKFAIVRNTYDMLETTTLATFKQWIPHEICGITLKPMRGNMEYPLQDGTKVECKFIFLALDRPDDVKKLLSLEVTGVFMNEARELPYAVVKGSRERIGRYPSQIDGYTDVYDGNGKLTYDAPKELGADGKPLFNTDGTPKYKPCTRKSLLMDTNPPEDDHWWYQLAEDGCLRSNQTAEAKKAVAEIFDFFRGVAPFTRNGDQYIDNPLAENIKFLPGGFKYYRDMLAGNTEDHINVMVMGNYGTIKDGKPVYPQYNDRIHCPEKPLGIIEDLPIGLGWDGGLTPACVIGQQTKRGIVRVIAELQAEDMGVRQFARDVVKPFLQRNFHGIEIAFSYFDPSGIARGESEAKSAIGILNDEYIDDGDENATPLNMGFETEPAPTNDIQKRIDAVNSYIIRLIDGEPAYQLSKACKMLRKGKIGGYQYKRIQVAGDERYRDKPDKDKHSHCFVGNTSVLTDSGPKNISDIKIGDMVVTPIGFRQVTKLMGRVSEVMGLILNNGRAIFCTKDHPFITKSGIVLAEDLGELDILTSNFGHEVRVVRSFHTMTKGRVYDITVSEAHCFYANGVLVSNCSDSEQYLFLGFAGGYVIDSSDVYDSDYDDFNIDDVGPMGY